MTRLTVLPLAAAILLSTSCGKGKKLTIESYHLGPAVTSQHFIAGVGRAEITPYPGIPLGGHGPGGRIARGTWMPLYARAFYFRDEKGNAAAMVSCDLFSVTAGLRADVLRRVNQTVRLEPASLFLSATHTHHGPANFSTSAAYNSFAGPLPNFDKALFDFLAERIAAATVQAIQDARSHAAEDHALLLYAGYAPGLQRNRAIAPFFRNDAAVTNAIQAESAAAHTHCPDGTTENCPRYFATDPSLKILEIRRRGNRVGFLVFHAIHATAMTHDAELYSPDLVGVAMGKLEQEHSGSVAGFFNGAEGDVSPDWVRQDREDVIRLGERLGKASIDLLGSAPVAQTTAPAFEIKWNHAARGSKEWKQAGFGDPVGGAGEAGGAEDGRTLFYNYGWRGEARNDGSDPKLRALDKPADDFAASIGIGKVNPLLRFFHVEKLPKPDSFPVEFPVARLRLDSLATFAFVPVEPTTVVGRRIRESLGANTIVVGLSNEYFGYTVSPNEYDLQQYEGASTLMGRHEMDGIVELLNRAQTERAVDPVKLATFYPGVWREDAFGPDTVLLRIPRNMPDDDLQPVMPQELRRLESRIPRFSWPEDRSGDRESPRRHAAIYRRPSAQQPYSLLATDKTSPDFATVLDGVTTRTYTTLWFPPAEPLAGAQYYFSVETGDGKTLCSATFDLGHLEAWAPAKVVPASNQCPPR